MNARKETWVESLSLYLDRVGDESFKWGSHDCALFAAGAINAVTGEDLSENFKGQYSSVREAVAWLRAHDYSSFQEAITDQLGLPVHTAKAGRGDIVMRRVGNGNALGVCVGKQCWFLGDEVVGYDADYQPIYRTGLVSWPTLLCDWAWKIGSLEDNSNG